VSGVSKHKTSALAFEPHGRHARNSPDNTVSFLTKRENDNDKNAPRLAMSSNKKTQRCCEASPSGCKKEVRSGENLSTGRDQTLPSCPKELEGSRLGSRV